GAGQGELQRRLVADVRPLQALDLHHHRALLTGAELGGGAGGAQPVEAGRVDIAGQGQGGKEGEEGGGAHGVGKTNAHPTAAAAEGRWLGAARTPSRGGGAPVRPGPGSRLAGRWESPGPVPPLAPSRRWRGCCAPRTPSERPGSRACPPRPPPARPGPRRALPPPRAPAGGPTAPGAPRG